MTAKRYHEYFTEVCAEEGVYLLTIGWKGGKDGHATILQRFSDGRLSYIEPQRYSENLGIERNVNDLCNAGAAEPIPTRGILRIDNKLFDVRFASIFDKA